MNLLELNGLFLLYYNASILSVREVFYFKII